MLSFFVVVVLFSFFTWLHCEAWVSFSNEKQRDGERDERDLKVEKEDVFAISGLV